MVAPLENISLMIVDDDPHIRKAHRDMAEVIGVGNIFDTDSGADAIREIDKDDIHFDAILLDILMPQQDAIEILKEFADRNVRSPIIIVSAAPQNLTAVVSSFGSAKELNIEAIIRKPLTIDVLNALVKKISSQ